MKKTLVALVGAVLLLAVVMFLDHRRDVSRLSEKFAFDTAQKADVAYVRVILQRDTTVLLKAGGQWVAMPDSFPVDTAKMNKNLSILLGLQSKEMVSSDSARLSEYGLDTSEAKHVEWRTAQGGIYQVVIGKTSGVDYSSTYWKFEDQPGVYSTPGDFTWEIGTHSADWKDRNLFKLDPRDIKDVRVDWRDSADALYHYKLEKMGDTAIRMIEPESSQVVKGLSRRIMAEVLLFSIDDFTAPGDTNLSKARLDTPIVDVKVDLKSGNTYEIKGGRTLAGFVYVQDPFRRDVVKLAAGRFDPFEKTPDQLSGKDTGQVAAAPVKKMAKVKKH